MQRISRNAVILSLLLALQCLSVLSNDVDQIKAKLEELDRRLTELELKRSTEAPAPSKTTGQEATVVEVEELRRQLAILAEEVEKLRSGEAEIELSDQRARSLGVGPAAASVYRKTKGPSIAGYGEMLYENFASQDQSGAEVDRGSQLDFLRAVLYTGYRFNKRFLFNSEVEFEHASTGKGGEVSVEFAYMDFLASDNFTLRGGLLLVPMGLVNEYHEPNVFLGSRRSATETFIIPSTWRENGFGVLGDFGKLSFRAYLVNGLDALKFSSSGIRGGRQGGAKAKAEDFAFVGRLDMTPVPGLFFGGSLYRGGSGQKQFDSDEGSLKVPTTIFDLHSQFQFRGWDFRALYAQSSLGDVSALNHALGSSTDDSIAEVMRGGFAQVGYDILSQFREDMSVTPFYRFERVDTQAELAEGYVANPGKRQSFHTVGLEFKPIYQFVIKSDYQWQFNDAESGLSQFNIGLGYSF